MRTRKYKVKNVAYRIGWESMDRIHTEKEYRQCVKKFDFFMRLDKAIKIKK